MKTNLNTRLLCLAIAIISFSNPSRAGVEPIPTGSFIVNMGVIPQTYGNGIKPWGMIYDLIHNYRVQVKWVIGQSKLKDGIDFNYSGTDFKGGTFIIPARYRNPTTDARISYWQTQGVVGTTTTTNFSVDVTYNLKYTPRWTFDFQNGNIAIGFLDAAGIPSGDYPKKLPSELSGCDDLFVMPHADPTWATHSNLLNWNQSNNGWIWAGCHAVSVLENLVNPSNASEKMNFLTQQTLVPFGSHSQGSPPYSYRFPTDPEMQFMGITDDAQQNGSEQIFLPQTATWRASTKVAVYDPTQQDIPGLSPGEAGAIVYGRAFGDNLRGKIMYTGGHNIEKGNADAVAAMRTFFNFSFLSVYDKVIALNITGQINLVSLSSYSYRASLPAGNTGSNLTFHWSSSCGGTFSNPFDSVTIFTAPLNSACTNCTLSCTIIDDCGREYYQDYDINICPITPPVALDRTMLVINNPDGTGPQAISNPVPLAGTDQDGYVVNYVLKSLPSNGTLYYDQDNNPATAKIPINTLPTGELVLTATQMKTLDFDPVDGFGSNTSFLYTVTDNSNLRDLTPATYTIPVNPPPVALTKICTPVPSNAGLSTACSLQATDNGTIVSYTIKGLPSASQCTIFVNNVQAYVGQILTPAQTTAITYKPSGTYVGYAEILYTATDNDGATDLTAATLTLQMVNQPPTANDVTSATIANPIGSTMFNMPSLSAIDNDGSINTFKIINKSTSNKGILYYNTSGTSYAPVTDNQVLTTAQAASLKFDPTDNFNGVASFTFTATDNLGLTDNTPANFFVPVQMVPPVATDITNASIYAGGGWKPITSLSGTDPDATNMIVSYKILSIPAASEGKIGFGSGPTVVITAGMILTPAEAANLKFDPKKDFTGTTQFTYTCTDDEGLSDQSAAIVLLTAFNNPPAAKNIINAAISNSAGQTVLSPFDGTDPDEMPMTGNKFTITELPSAATGTLYCNGIAAYPGQVVTPAQVSTLKFDPNISPADTAIFTYSVTDEGKLADPTPALFKIPLIKTLVPPVSTDTIMAPASVNQTSIRVPTLNGTDADGTVVAFRIQAIGPLTTGSLYLNAVMLNNNDIVPFEKANQIYFMPNGSNTGTYIFKYKSIDNDGLQSAITNVSISLINVNPVAFDRNLNTVKKNITTSIPGLLANDVDGSIVSFTVLSLPTLGTLQCDLAGTNVFTTLTAGQILTAQQASRLQFLSSNVIGTSTFNYRATDNSGQISNTASYNIPINVQGVNQLPYVNNITNAPLTLNAPMTAINPLSGTDGDGSITSYTLLSVPPYFYGKLFFESSPTVYDSISVGGKVITPAQASTLKFRPSGEFSGTITITYKAMDNNGGVSAEAAFYKIQVTNNDPVTINITNASVASNMGPAFLQSLQATDDGTLTSFSVTELPLPSQGTLVLDGSPVTTQQMIPLCYANRLEFDPNPSFIGTASFKYTATDNFGAFDKTPATVSIPVTNSLPFAEDKSSQVITNQLGTGSVFLPALNGFDNDGTISTYLIQTIPSGGKLYVNGVLVSSIPVGGYAVIPANASKLSFDPDENWGGIAFFTYTVKDNNNNLSAAASRFDIPVNLPPVTSDITTSPFASGAPRAAIPALVGSDDGIVSFYTITLLPDASKGSLYVNNVIVNTLSQVSSLTPAQISQLSFQPTANFDGAIFTYTATDNLGIIDVTPAVYTIPWVYYSTLPVTLLQFNGVKSGLDNILQWTTAGESNSKHFDLEYSLNGNIFDKIATLTAQGTTSAVKEYSYLHKQVQGKTAYYRLKMYDLDLNFKYSDIVVIKRDGIRTINYSVYPNPFVDKVMVWIVSETVTRVNLYLTDMNGKVLSNSSFNLQKGNNTINLEQFKNLVPGNYVLIIKNDEINYSIKLLKSGY